MPALLPGLLNDAALWEHQTRHLGDIAQMQVPDLSGHDSIRALAESVLAAVASAWAMQVPTELICAGLRTFGSEASRAESARVKH